MSNLKLRQLLQDKGCDARTSRDVSTFIEYALSTGGIVAAKVEDAKVQLSKSGYPTDYSAVVTKGDGRGVSVVYTVRQVEGQDEHVVAVANGDASYSVSKREEARSGAKVEKTVVTESKAEAVEVAPVVIETKAAEPVVMMTPEPEVVVVEPVVVEAEVVEPVVVEPEVVEPEVVEPEVVEPVEVEPQSAAQEDDDEEDKKKPKKPKVKK